MNRPLLGWLVADGTSLVGTRVSMVALPFFVLSTTGSAAQTGLVALAEMLPLVVLKVAGGPIIDHVGARRVAVTCDLGSVLVIGAVPLLHELGRLPLPLFLGLVAVAGALRGPGDAAKYSLTPALARSSGAPLERVTGLHSTVERTASMLGAGLAGGLVATVGPANALVVDAASFALSAALLAWAVPARAGRADDAPVDSSPYLTRLREGWAFLRGDRVLVGMTVMVALTNLIDVAWTTVLVPVWALKTGGGAAVVGLLFALFSGASALGSLVAASWGARMPRYSTYVVCFLVAGFPRFAVTGLEAPLAAVLGVAVLGGFAAGFLNPILGAVSYERVPAALVGRVSSLSTAACYALMPLGGLLGGGLVDGVGLAGALLLCGAAYLVVTMLPAVDPHWREIDSTRSPPGRSVTRPGRA